MQYDVEQHLHHLQLRCRYPVEHLLAGEYHSVFKGRGIEFESVREYAHGDDVRMIDWKVTARTGRPHVKRFIEERENAVFLLVDYSASGDFSGGARSKRDVVAEVCMMLALCALRNNDRIGLMIFTDRVEHYVPPMKGQLHVMRLIDDLLTFKPEHSGTRISEALDFMGHVARKRAIGFVVSDFIDTDFTDSLGVLACRHDMIAVKVESPQERRFDDAGLVLMRDSESGEQLLVDTRSDSIRSAFEAQYAEQRQELLTLLMELGVDSIDLSTEQDVVPVLIEFFNKRYRRIIDEAGG
ncbi:DUF58 domain-containing protein [Verrucomicrobiota bacterium]